MNPRILRIAFVACLTVAAAAAWVLVERLSVAPTAREAAAAAIDARFTLVDQDGATVTQDAYRGRWMLVFFGFTHCPDVCPTTLFTLTEALKQLDAADRAQLAPIMITVDPARDTPEALKGYVAAFDAGWTGLGGSQEQVDQAVRGFRAYARRIDGEAYADGYTMDHSAFVYLIGPDGVFRQVFSPQDPADSVAAGIRTALVAG